MLAGRTALVTGGARGIGLAISQQFAHNGACVLVASRSKERAVKAASALPCDLSGQRHLGVECDVCDTTQLQQVVSDAREADLPINVLVNNAGVNADGLLIRFRKALLDQVLAVNLTGTIQASRAVLPSMLRQGSGSILNIGSIVGLDGHTGQSVYAAAKAGLVGFTKSLARELGAKDITVNLVAPGFIANTAMTSALPSNHSETLREKTCLKRLGHVDDVAHAVVFLVGPQARFITGQVLRVDGGLQL